MEAYCGMIASFGFSFAPHKWAFCSGQIVAISQNPTLNSLISNLYGGDGRTTFGYPDLRSRVPVGATLIGTLPGLMPFAIGTKNGLQYHTLTEAQMPTHSHIARFTPGEPAPLDVTVKASTSSASKRAPSAGDYIGSQPAIGTFPNMYVAGATPGTTVQLGGVTASGGKGSGTVNVEPTGNSVSFPLLNPFQAINYCICEDGIYPSRN
ncbi:phage tail protein [Pacificispira sp.]|uniref:phage tail protein n=1 Tax=Pacificispira sp. TaxID=2888761 RepID=UPI003BA937F0